MAWRARPAVSLASLVWALLVGGALAWPLVVAGQPAGSMPRIGIVVFTHMSSNVQEGFRQGFRDHGYVEGQNLAVEWRSAEGSVSRADAIAEELVRLKVDVIMAEFTPVVRAARRATQTIPIVMVSAGDPVGTGLVESLSRPGGNVTGLSNVAVELSGKRLDLLREVRPGLARVGMLVQGSDPLERSVIEETRRAAASSGIQLHVATVPRPEALSSAFAALMKERVGAVVVLANLPVPAQRVAQVAAQHRLPTISIAEQFADAGGLMSYGASATDIRRRAVGFVDRILKGARPADLPVERPTIFELVINRKTARAIGLAMPQSMLIRADRVID